MAADEGDDLAVWIRPSPSAVGKCFKKKKNKQKNSPTKLNSENLKSTSFDSSLIRLKKTLDRSVLSSLFFVNRISFFIFLFI